jgi:glutamate racemase
LEQGPVVAEKLKDYLRRHPEIKDRLTCGGARTFLTTDLADRFDRLARIFFGEPIRSQLISFDEEADRNFR